MSVDYPSLQMFGIKTPLITPGDNITDIIIEASTKKKLNNINKKL